MNTSIVLSILGAIVGLVGGFIADKKNEIQIDKAVEKRMNELEDKSKKEEESQ